MATTLNSLSAADQADFLKRLSIFGLDSTSILQPDLIVPPKTTMSLSSTSANSFLRPHLLSTTDLDELKSWIGIPDQHFQSGLLKSTLTAPLRSLSTAAATPAVNATVSPLARAATLNTSAIQTLGSAQFDNLRTAAVSYIWGDSSVSATFKSEIESAFQNFQVAVWPFLTITVSAGSVLEIGAGPQVLCAWKIIIQEGGQIRGVGSNLHVQCTVMQKTATVIKAPFNRVSETLLA